MAGENRSELYAMMLDRLQTVLLLFNDLTGSGWLRTEHNHSFYRGDHGFLDSGGETRAGRNWNNSLDAMTCDRIECHAEALVRGICG